MPIHQQMDQAMTILLSFVMLLYYWNGILLQKINIFIVYRRQKYIFFIVYRRQDGNAICPRERFASTKHLQRRQISLLGVRKPVFFVEVRPFEATSEYTGCIPWNSYVSDSYDSFAWFLPCWGRGLQGCWKRGVILDFAVQMAAAGHILACRWSQMPPQS